MVTGSRATPAQVMLAEVRSRGGRPTLRHHVEVDTHSGVYATPPPVALCGLAPKGGWVASPAWPQAECPACRAVLERHPEGPAADAEPAGPFRLQAQGRGCWEPTQAVGAPPWFTRLDRAQEEAREWARRNGRDCRVVDGSGAGVVRFDPDGRRAAL